MQLLGALTCIALITRGLCRAPNILSRNPRTCCVQLSSIRFLVASPIRCLLCLNSRCRNMLLLRCPTRTSIVDRAWPITLLVWAKLFKLVTVMKACRILALTSGNVDTY